MVRKAQGQPSASSAPSQLRVLPTPLPPHIAQVSASEPAYRVLALAFKASSGHAHPCKQLSEEA